MNFFGLRNLNGTIEMMLELAITIFISETRNNDMRERIRPRFASNDLKSGKHYACVSI